MARPPALALAQARLPTIDDGSSICGAPAASRPGLSSLLLYYAVLLMFKTVLLASVHHLLIMHFYRTPFIGKL